MTSESTRMFEMKEGTSDKFWEISLNGKSHSIRYGRVGTEGQKKDKEFASEAEARKAYDKLIAEKTGKGYREVTGSSDSRQLKAKALQTQAKERVPFIKAILDAPDDPSAYMVFADWLEDHGDPQGELIRVQWELENPDLKTAERKKIAAREAALLKEHESTWLGDLAELLIEQKVPDDLYYGTDKPYQWQIARGFLDSLQITYLLPSFAKALKKSPLTSTLRKLAIQNPSNGYELSEIDEYSEMEFDEDDAPSLKMLSGASFENLRLFEVTDHEDSNCHCRTPTVHNLIKGMPRLETLQIDAHGVDIGAIFRLQLPELRSLTLQHTSSRHPLEALAKNESMNKLERLHIQPHAKEMDDDEEGAYLDFKGFQGLCRSSNLKSLRHLVLIMSDVGDAGLAELVKSPLFKQLRTLHLIYGIITDEGVDTLCNAGLKHLESLDLTGNYLTVAGVQKLKAAFPAAKADSQYSGSPTDEYEYLWNGDIE